jgi:hypothetical protein
VGDNTTTTKFGGGGKIEKEDIKDNNTGGKTSKEAREAKDTQNEKAKQIDTSVGINSPISINNWEDILNIIGSPSKHVLTKENYELVNSVLNSYEYAIIHNIYDFIKDASTDKCFHERLLKFITISKIGASLSQFKQIRLNAIIQAITQQANMYNSALNQLGAVVSSFQHAYILREVVNTTPPSTDIQITNIAIDLKVVGIIAALIGALTAIGLEIGNLKNDLRAQIAIDEYCLTGCSTNCTSSTTIMELRAMLDNNEGKITKEYTDKVMSWLDRLVEIEFKYLEKELSKEAKPPNLP